MTEGKEEIGISYDHIIISKPNLGGTKYLSYTPQIYTVQYHKLPHSFTLLETNLTLIYLRRAERQRSEYLRIIVGTMVKA